MSAEFRALPQAERELLSRLSRSVHRCKAEMNGRISAAGAAEICAECHGACCRSGRYHFTRIDLLVYLSMEEEPFTPHFDGNACPYLGHRGCLMGEGFRPFNCSIFNCELLYELLSPRETERMALLERELRELYGRFPDRWRRPLL